MNPRPESDLLHVRSVGVDSGDLLVSIRVRKVKSDPFPVGSPVRQK